jgi:hypothetical protein
MRLAPKGAVTQPTRCRIGPFLLFPVVISLASAAAAPAGGEREAPGPAGPEEGWRWSLAEEPVAAEGGLLALAAGPGGALAAGDARGLLLGPASPGAGWRRLPLRGAVRDLAFAPDGALWVASDEGLFRFTGDRLAARPPAPGDAARAALRVVVGAGALAVATRDGVHWSRDGERFARVEGGFGDAETSAEADDDEQEEAADPPSVHGLALAADARGRPTLWIAAQRGLFRAVLASRDGAARVRAEPVATPVELRPALDVTLDGDGVRALGRSALLAGDATGASWRVERPELPPGAIPARLLATPRGLWIASDRGLVRAPHAGGPWSRAPEPAGSKPAVALAHVGDALLVAGALGLVVGEVGAEPAMRPAAEPERAAAPGGRRTACDPPIAAVQRAALAHLDLTGARTARMWRGVRSRGALPIVALDGSIADDRRHYRTWDESFSSGETHRLFDRDRDREREQAVALRLSWDLGALLYHPEEIDVSTEMRRTIELRDDVLDELNQLYFERRRAREAAAQAGPGTPDATRESLRAEELAAGIDAWTGGWFGPRAGASPCPPGDG